MINCKNAIDPLSLLLCLQMGYDYSGFGDVQRVDDGEVKDLCSMYSFCVA